MKRIHVKVFCVLSFFLLSTLLVPVGVTYGKNPLSKTFKWYHEAAEQGLPEAQFYMGKMYHKGYYKGAVVPIDYTEAARWYKQAAEQGLPEAQVELGRMYVFGVGGLLQSESEGVKWFHKAAEQGNPDGQYCWGNYLETETKTKAEAFKWHKKSAERGYKLAQIKMGDYYNCRYSYCDYDINYPKAIKWYQLAAEQGSVYSQYRIGQMYYKGHGFIQDYTEAARWYKQAAEQGHKVAQYDLVIMYEKGIGVPINCVKAYAWFLLANYFKVESVGQIAETKNKEFEEKMTEEQIKKSWVLAKGLGERIQLQDSILGPYDYR